MQGTGSSVPVLSIQAEVVLGSPAKQCAGLGICKILPIKYQMDGQCPCIRTIICALPSGKVQCAFPVSELPESVFQQHFSGPYFQVDAVCWLPLWLCKQLGLQARRAITPGAYPIQKIAGWFIVVC